MSGCRRAAARGRATVLVIAAIAALAPGALGQPVEPPPESPEGADWEAEPADSLPGGVVELGFGASGRGDGAPTRRRRLRYRDDEVSAALREGPGDPLTGGAVEGRGAAGAMTIGRMAPLWGRGLLLGAAADPWRRVPLDRGPRAAFRGRAGEGVLLSRGEGRGVEALCGSFSRRRLGGVRGRWDGLALGALAESRGSAQGSLSLGGERTEVEVAADRRGRWRAEGLGSRALGEWTASARVRGGLDGFRSLAEPARSGPARALSLGVLGPTSLGTLEALGAIWRHAPGRAGARIWCALERRADDGSELALGIGEQHGALRADAARPGGFRQGGWVQWRSAPGPIAVALRHETWGRRARARESTRAASSAGLELRGPFGLTMRVSHSVYRVGSGESLYLPELDPDRLVLRALSGEGERTRLEARVPAGGGRAAATLELARPSGRPGELRWAFEWARRARASGSRR